MDNVLGTFLEKVRNEKKLSLREVANKSGLGHSYIRDLELGINRKTGKKVSPSTTSLKKIADAYKLDFADLLNMAGIIDLKALQKEDETGNSAQNPASMIPLLQSITSNEKLLDSSNILSTIYYPFPDGPQPDYAIKMQGNAMLKAGIEDGDIVYMRLISQPEFNGQIVAIRLTDHSEGLIRRITWSSSFAGFHLVSENASYRVIDTPFHHIEVCGAYLAHFTFEKP